MVTAGKSGLWQVQAKLPQTPFQGFQKEEPASNLTEVVEMHVHVEQR